VSNINLDALNNLINIYNNLSELFNCNIINEKNMRNSNLNKINMNEKIISLDHEIKILSYKYINFIFSNDMELIIKLFYNNIEIQKYFISQIYFFISIIYYEESIMSNSYLLISYKTIVFYSLNNLEKIINIVNLPLLLKNDKILNSIKSTNKIILSILKIINPKIPSNSQIIDFISPIKTNKNNIKSDEIQSSGILKLISLLKVNSNLNGKLFKSDIQKINNIENNSKEKNTSNNGNTNTNTYNSKDKENKLKKDLINGTKKAKLMLPPMDTKKYKYSIAVELDETLVHYFEEGDNYYAKVRFGSENFLKNISNYLEIIVISTSGKEYSDIIIDNINKDDKCYVEHRIYTEDYNKGPDLSKINRDFKKIIFICHEYNFFNVPKENIILLKEFKGEEDDREIIKLYNELKIFNNNRDVKYNNLRKIHNNELNFFKNKIYENNLKEGITVSNRVKKINYNH
jgi:import inner membrane translocase subunit TIM50